MFGSSTQLIHWTFKNESEVQELRKVANEEFIEKYSGTVQPENKDGFFLSLQEENDLVEYYEHSLYEFCKKFTDPRDARIRMPPNVITTAQHYFKRFYLYNSVMDYHPKEILVTCVYLACKIEEFYVTILDFVHNVKGDKKKAAEIILNTELQLTQELQFHLIVHQPYRPVEGLLIDIKTRYPELEDPEALRPLIDEFLEKVHMTDAIVLYSPSQIALAAIIDSVSKRGSNLDKYVTDILLKDREDYLPILIEAVRKIKKMVKNFKPPITESVRRQMEAKLEKCRNQQNNPNSAQYRANYSEWDDDDLPLAPPENFESTDTDDTLGLGVERIRSPASY